MLLTSHLENCPFSEHDKEAIVTNLLKNIATNTHSLTFIDQDTVLKALPGAIIASPSLPDHKFSQSYFFHWVRDGAISINAICDLYVEASSQEKKIRYREMLVHYLHFVEVMQTQPMLHGIHVLGEPKFNIDGSVWSQDWGRPQLGGTAFQAIVLSKILGIFEAEGAQDLVHKIYNTDSNSLLKANLEHCARTWAENSVNVWEELKGNHFSVRFVQYIALNVGAAVAKRLNDPGAAAYYHDIRGHLEDELRTHWKESLGYYFETIHQENKLGGGLDASVLNALFAGHITNIAEDFVLTSYQSLSTFYSIRQAFEGLYQINVARRAAGKRGVLLGRYPQDVYDGNYDRYGNPWFITSLALASVYYGIILQLLQGNTITANFLAQQFLRQVAPTLHFECHDRLDAQHKHYQPFIQNLFEEAEAILCFIKECMITESDGSTMHMSEQIDRASGAQVSAKDLSWSYAALLSTLKMRETVLTSLRNNV